MRSYMLIGKLRILIAEDETVSAAMLESLALAEGHEVCGIVAQGGAALEAVQRLRPDVVLMDVHLADGVSGIEATKNLLRRVQVPVIVISATECPDEQRKIAESGALGFMKKPVSPHEFRVNLRIAAHHNAVMRKLRDSELLHRSLFDNAAVGIYVCHEAGHYLAANRAFARMLGYVGPAEMLRTVHSVAEQVYVEEGRHEALLHELKTGQTLRDVESQVYGCDGDRLWVSEHLGPHFDENGRFLYYEGVVINITAKKKAEADKALAYALVQTTMDAIADFVVVVDLDGNIIVANKAFEAELGAVVGAQRVFSFADDVKGPLAMFRHMVQNTPGQVHPLRQHCRVSGYAEELDVTVSPFTSPEGELVGAVLVMRPVSGRW